MNKQECKKYLKRAYKSIIESNKILNVKNVEEEMKRAIEKQMEEYIAYSKIAVHNVQMSGNIKITLKDLISQIDVLPKIYTRSNAIVRAKNL